MATIAIACAGALLLAKPPIASDDKSAPGHLEAQGNGSAYIIGGGAVKLKGRGVIWFRDFAGDAEYIKVSGKGKKTKVGEWWFVMGVDGAVKIKGSRMAVHISGRNLQIDATGHGSAWLLGAGSVQLGDREGAWGHKMKPFHFGKLPRGDKPPFDDDDNGFESDPDDDEDEETK